MVSSSRTSFEIDSVHNLTSTLLHVRVLLPFKHLILIILDGGKLFVPVVLIGLSLRGLEETCNYCLETFTEPLFAYMPHFEPSQSAAFH